MISAARPATWGAAMEVPAIRTAWFAVLCLAARIPLSAISQTPVLVGCVIVVAVVKELPPGPADVATVTFSRVVKLAMS